MLAGLDIHRTHGHTAHRIKDKRDELITLEKVTPFLDISRPCTLWLATNVSGLIETSS